MRVMTRLSLILATVGLTCGLFTSATAAAAPVPGTEGSFIRISTNTTSATITLTAPPLHACGPGLIARGTPADATAVAWAGGGLELYFIDPALADTAYSAWKNTHPEYFGERTITENLAAGRYVFLTECTRFTPEGSPDSDKLSYYKPFTITSAGGPGPGDNNNSWGSLGSLLS